MSKTKTKPKISAKHTKAKKAVPKKTAGKKAATSPAKAGLKAKAKVKTAPKKSTQGTAAKKPASAKGASIKRGAGSSGQAQRTAVGPPAVPAVKKDIPPKPIKSKLPKSFLNSQLQKLKTEREKYIGSAEVLEEEAESLLSGRVSSDIQSAEESGEGDTTSYYREMDLALSAQSREVVLEIDAAIERIKDGTYGVCVDTGKPIPKKRLEAIPWASQTVGAKAGGLRRRH